ncbi:MAG: ORF6N domain-containing protein [Myxococcota bacterium]|nr:ORF6N domain-containing protein [Myxococcota bacterium]
MRPSSSRAVSLRPPVLGRRPAGCRAIPRDAVDLAVLYGVDTRSLNQAVKRSIERFPSDFMFQLTPEEYAAMRSRFVISSRRGRGRAPFAFTEHGVAMLSSVLRSRRAVQVNIEIMRAFARLRSILASHGRLARKLDALEKIASSRV